jgi:hypothetical protein
MILTTLLGVGCAIAVLPGWSRKRKETPSLVKPYLQLGDAPRRHGREALAALAGR